MLVLPASSKSLVNHHYISSRTICEKWDESSAYQVASTDMQLARSSSRSQMVNRTSESTLGARTWNKFSYRFDESASTRLARPPQIEHHASPYPYTSSSDAELLINYLGPRPATLAYLEQIDRQLDISLYSIATRFHEVLTVADRTPIRMDSSL